LGLWSIGLNCLFYACNKAYLWGFGLLLACSACCGVICWVLVVVCWLVYVIVVGGIVGFFFKDILRGNSCFEGVGYKKYSTF